MSLFCYLQQYMQNIQTQRKCYCIEMGLYTYYYTTCTREVTVREEEVANM